jgi:beta-glucosidase/6-phospho-beta-glucosidase/beta-galactosidase
VAALKASGQIAYRFSIEWARVYPTRADFDADTPNQAALDAYTSLLTKLQTAGITPLVTMIHYSLPDYIDDITQAPLPQGFERSDVPDLVATWCGRVAKRWGANVDWWATLNEPTLPPLTGYIAARYPPGLVLQTDRALAYARGEGVAHAKCFDAIHANDTTDVDGDGKAAMVSLVNQSRAVEPVDPTNDDDVAAASLVRFINNLWFWRVAVNGDWDDDFDGDYTGAKDRLGDPTLKGRADYIGLNYYSALMASARSGIVIPGLNIASPMLDHLPTSRPKTDAYLDIYPDGFRVVIEELKDFNLPFVITENGIADSQDKNRARFIAEHVFQVGWAIQRGFDIRGYFHWSLLDNFEWDQGFCPKFGLESVDQTTAARTARPSMMAYKGIIAAGKVAQADIDAMPAYAPPSPCN